MFDVSNQSSVSLCQGKRNIGVLKRTEMMKRLDITETRSDDWVGVFKKHVENGGLGALRIETHEMVDKVRDLSMGRLENAPIDSIAVAYGVELRKKKPRDSDVIGFEKKKPRTHAPSCDRESKVNRS